MMRHGGVIGIDIGTESVKAVALESVSGEILPRVVSVGAALFWSQKNSPWQSGKL